MVVNNDDISRHFFEASYRDQRIQTTAEIDLFASTLTFPSVVHISNEPRFTGDHNPVAHTLLALDYTEQGIVAWEKRGWYGEFRIATTTELLTDRPNFYWGSRTLRSN